MCVGKWGQEGLCFVETEIISYSQYWLGAGGNTEPLTLAELG